ncbi:adenine deaminase [Saitozyma sp. JCM 24511]|nr:adenine deaminase [Saitozyma sp. JCM 24511]
MTRIHEHDHTPHSVDFLRALPKCEHHLHIEGSLSPALLFRLAAHNAITLPSHAVDVAYASIEALEARYRSFTSLDDFLDYYNRASAVLITRTDFEALAYEYMKKAHADGIVHAEISFDLQTHTARGISIDDVVHGLNDGLNKGQADFGISFRLIMCILRHLPVSSSVDHMHLAKPFFDAGLIFGLGMCSTEKSQPPTKFRPVFDLAREFGIGYLTAHAGEEGPADYVRQALEELGVQRIDHGVRSLEEDEVVDMLVKRETLLTVCPLSNVCLQVKPRLEDVPLRELLERGVRFSLNSDDPAYFGGYLLENYVQVQRAFDFAPSDWRTIVANGIEGSWMPDEQKEKLIERLDAVIAACK